VPDGTLKAIDRLFDFVDLGVEHVDRILHRGQQTAERQLARKQKRDRAEIVKVPPARTRARGSSQPRVGATATALARKPGFYIVEAVTPSGVTEYVVTDGGNARAACPSRASAEQILQALEKAL
jgi:hypothetical protein